MKQTAILAILMAVPLLSSCQDATASNAAPRKPCMTRREIGRVVAVSSDALAVTFAMRDGSTRMCLSKGVRYWDLPKGANFSAVGMAFHDGAPMPESEQTKKDR